MAIDASNTTLVAAGATAAAIAAYVLLELDRPGARRLKRTVGGLVNEGETCFANCVLQALTSLQLLEAHLERSAAADQPLHKALQELLGQLRERRSTQHSHSARAVVQSLAQRLHVDPALLSATPLSPSLEWVKRWTVGRHAKPMFRGGGQQDAHDFLHELLAQLGQETVDAYVASKPLASGVSDLGLHEHIGVVQRPDYPVASLPACAALSSLPFRGEMASQWTCLSCHCASSVKLSSFTAITLNNASNLPHTSISVLLGQYFTPETIEDVNCEQCALIAAIQELDRELVSLLQASAACAGAGAIVGQAEARAEAQAVAAAGTAAAGAAADPAQTQEQHTDDAHNNTSSNGKSKKKKNKKKKNKKKAQAAASEAAAATPVDAGEQLREGEDGYVSGSDNFAAEPNHKTGQQQQEEACSQEKSITMNICCAVTRLAAKLQSGPRRALLLSVSDTMRSLLANKGGGKCCAANAHPDVELKLPRCPRNAKLLTHISSLPSMLCVHIDSVGFGLGGAVKQQRHVSYSESLCLKAAEKETDYQVQAVVAHHGSANNGHYVTYRRLPAVTANGRDRWVLASDEHVEPVDLYQVLKANPYLIFYERKTKPTAMATVD